MNRNFGHFLLDVGKDTTNESAFGAGTPLPGGGNDHGGLDGDGGLRYLSRP